MLMIGILSHLYLENQFNEGNRNPKSFTEFKLFFDKLTNFLPSSPLPPIPLPSPSDLSPQHSLIIIIVLTKIIQLAGKPVNDTYLFTIHGVFSDNFE